MTRFAKTLATAALGLATSAGTTEMAYAQNGAVAAAIASASVGEQADGYLGIRGTVSQAVRAEVESINIKRRAGYTDLAGQRGVTVKDVAAAVGCKTLAGRVSQGQAYLLPDGVWRVREASPIALPAYCAS